MSEMTDFNDLARVAGADAVKAEVDRVLASAAEVVSAEPVQVAAHAAAEQAVWANQAPVQEWPELMLPGAVQVPDIPVELLPDWLGAMAGAVARSTQTPPALAVMVGLSVLAAVLHRRFEVSPFADEYTEPLSLWTLAALPSGSRKSSVFSAMTAPLLRWERLEYDLGRRERMRVEAARKVAEKRIEKLLSDAAKAKDEDERERIRAEIQQEKEAMPAELLAPRLFTEDVTAERLQALLAEHGERMAVLSDEGGIFNIMSGLYSGGAANLDAFLKGHAGTAIRVDRAGRQAHIDKPALTFGLALQPEVFEEVAASRRFRASGLLARFLYVIPESNVGRRDVRLRASVPDLVREEYEARIFSLLENVPVVIGRPRVLPMTEPALELWADFAQEIEEQQGDGCRLESIRDWTSKLPGAVARVAALFELADVGRGAEDVSEVATMRAVELGRLLIPHALAAFGMLGGDAVDADCQALLKWVQAQGLAEFTKRECRRGLSGRFSSNERLNKAVARLVDRGALRQYTRRNKGAPSSDVFLVNPAVCHCF